MVANSPKPTPEPTKPSTKQPVEKQKELQYSKPLPKDKAEGSSVYYLFVVLAQLANISARITLYELLRLLKSTREVPREALADAEVFMARILAELQEDHKENCLHTSPCITFTPDDMQGKRKHDRSLNFTGYIGSSEVSRIQVDPDPR